MERKFSPVVIFLAKQLIKEEHYIKYCKGILMFFSMMVAFHVLFHACHSCLVVL